MQSVTGAFGFPAPEDGDGWSRRGSRNRRPACPRAIFRPLRDDHALSFGSPSILVRFSFDRPSTLPPPCGSLPSAGEGLRGYTKPFPFQRHGPRLCHNPRLPSLAFVRLRGLPHLVHSHHERLPAAAHRRGVGLPTELGKSRGGRSATSRRAGCGDSSQMIFPVVRVPASGLPHHDPRT